MGNVIVNEKGKIYIAPEAIAQLAYRAVSECFGVVGMQAKNFAQYFRGEGGNKGIEVKIKEDALYLTIQIQVGYGTKISEVAKNVSEAVHYTIRQYTGIKIDHLDIKIAGIRVLD